MMSAGPDKFASVPAAIDGDALLLPAWAEALVATVPAEIAKVGNVALQTRLTDDVSLVSARVARAADLASHDFEAATTRMYDLIAQRLSSADASHPVRFWNFIPGIHATSGVMPASGEVLDRYMVFNAGRYAACRQWLGGEDAFPRLLATASGVGHDGRDLIIHALAAAEPGNAVENPRQVPAYKYSHRYGPKPPCFARATTVTLGGRQRVLVGGTASVRGEASVFVGDLRKQVGETLDNLAALLQSATGDDAAGPHLMSDLRVYYVRAEDLAALRSIVSLACPAATKEFVRADICRQDLLVEIEGVA
ncbi:chorismate transformation enzyme, FkbO/Hyg5 family [Humisphaera borealis]|uniref:Chorismatase FkbO/Hyg5-like N-terminal domain-containing protein n=1 Tax=Humisphaera borealis TaxID=2807512 RepID=A0A7M2X2H0_9BACT|nr:hypothetical protein [Humisphaera borealis]QOV91809.1 hypothetical protein IPV69_10830 [Humisphaera borealis]